MPWRSRDLILQGSFSDDDPVDSSDDEDAVPGRAVTGDATPMSSEAMMARDMAAIVHLPPEVFTLMPLNLVHWFQVGKWTLFKHW